MYFLARCVDSCIMVDDDGFLGILLTEGATELFLDLPENAIT